MNRPYGKMPIAQRAKQFAPFKAMQGLDEALRRKEEEHRLKYERESVRYPEMPDDDVADAPVRRTGADRRNR